jgi:hypothetical protein
MKKITITVMALVGTLAVTSCHGNYTCTCFFNGNEVYHQSSDDKSRKDAQTDCDLKETTIVGQTWDCDLK